MNDTRLETLTEQAFSLNNRVRELETNVLLLGAVCGLFGVLYFSSVKNRV